MLLLCFLDDLIPPVLFWHLELAYPELAVHSFCRYDTAFPKGLEIWVPWQLMLSSVVDREGSQTRTKEGVHGALRYFVCIDVQR